jgi:hypothetical protein
MSFSRIHRDWPTLLEQSMLLINRETFVSCPIQYHLLATRSTHSFSEFSRFQFQILGQLVNVIVIKHVNVLPLIAVHLSMSIGQNSVRAAIDIINKGFQIRIHGYLPLFLYSIFSK